MKKHKTIEALNSLIEINNNRIEGYAKACKYSKDKELKNILFQLMETCKRCKTELISEILQLGGVPSEGVTLTGRFFESWCTSKTPLKKTLKK